MCGSVVSGFLILVTLLTWTAGEKVSSFVCVLSKSCTLPCHFNDSLIEVMWFYERYSIPITHYPEDPDIYQLHLFKGRVSLFPDQIPKGNASLLFKEVELHDQGTYRCRGNKTEKRIQLNVYTVISSRDVVLEQVGDELVCKSEGIYPEPNVTWSPSVGTEPNTTVNVSEGLYSIFSSVRLSENPAQEEHSCNISTLYSSGRATVTPQHRDPSPDQNYLYRWFLLLLLVPLVLGLLVWRFCKRQKTENPVTSNVTAGTPLEALKDSCSTTDSPSPPFGERTEMEMKQRQSYEGDPLVTNNINLQKNGFQNGVGVSHKEHPESEV